MKIGSFNHPSKVVIAPMAGVTDQPFRNLCRDQGAYWVVSEMVSSDQKLWHTAKSANRLRFQSEAEPRWVQIAGGDPKMLADAARENEALGAQIIDINMGCPAKKVCKKAAGSALMRDEKLVARILDAVVKSVTIPVTLKIRLGWSLDEQNAVTIAKIAESMGVQLLTVHGRTKACKFVGEVNYAAIGEVVAAVNIPVIANGDIDSAEKAESVLRDTGAEAIMIGRAAQGRPWLARQVDHYLETGEHKKNPDLAEIKHMLATHINGLANFYGEYMGPRIARKHVGWYFSGNIAGNFSRSFSGNFSRRAGSEKIGRFLKDFNGLTNTAEQIEAIEIIFLAMQRAEGLAA